MRPRLRHDALGHLQKRQRRVAAVANQVDVARVREEPLEQRQVLHVHRRLVTPALFAALRRVRLVDGADRLAERHARPQPLADGLGAQLPLAQRGEPPQVVEEVVDVRPVAVAVRELRQEVRLVRDRELRVPVEHDPQQRRTRASDAEDDQRWRAHAAIIVGEVAMTRQLVRLGGGRRRPTVESRGQ